MSIVQHLAGNCHRRAVILSVCLGLIAGCVTGLNLSFGALLVVWALFNLNTLGFGVGWLVGCVIAGVTHGMLARLGALLLDESLLGDWLAMFSGRPLVAMMDLDRYDVAGGLAIGVLLACLAALILGRSVWLRGTEGSRGPMVRGYGLLGAALMIALVAWLPGWRAEHFIRSRVLAAVSYANGARLEVEQVTISPWTGKLVLEGVRVPDARHPDRDRLRLLRLTAQCDPGRLQQGKLHVNGVVMEGIERDVPRRQPAAPLARMPRSRIESHGELESRLHGTMDVTEWIKDRHELLGPITWLRDLVRAADLLACGATTHGDHEPAKASDQISRNSQHSSRCPLGHAEPVVLVEKVELKNLSSYGLGSRSRMILRNLSSDPVLTGEPTKLSLDAPRWKLSLTMNLNWHRPGRLHDVQVEVSHIPLAGLLAIDPKLKRAELKGGDITLAGKGRFDTRHLRLPLHAKFRHLDVSVASESSIANLSTSDWNQILGHAAAWRADVVLTGSWSDPRLCIDQRECLRQMARQLRSDNQIALASLLDGVAAGHAATRQTETKSSSDKEPRLAPSQMASTDVGSQLEQVVEQAKASAATDGSSNGIGREPSPQPKHENLDEKGNVVVTSYPETSAADWEFEDPAGTPADYDSDDEPSDEHAPVAALPPKRRLPGPINLTQGTASGESATPHAKPRGNSRGTPRPVSRVPVRRAPSAPSAPYVASDEQTASMDAATESTSAWSRFKGRVKRLFPGSDDIGPDAEELAPSDEETANAPREWTERTARARTSADMESYDDRLESPSEEPAESTEELPWYKRMFR